MVGIPKIIGTQRTVVREVIDHMASMVRGPKKLCAALAIQGDCFHDIAFDSPEEAHRQIADTALSFNSKAIPRRYRRIVGICPPKYPELWTAGKVSYKLQGCVEDGGELVIVAPHLDRVSASWGTQIEAVGYKTMGQLKPSLHDLVAKKIPLGVLAHVTHVRGDDIQTSNGERPRISIGLASRLSREHTESIGLKFYEAENLPWDLWKSDPDTLIVENAGEVLYRVGE
jgi:hypothetical protein